KLANLTRNPQATIKGYFDLIKEAEKALIELINSFKPIIDSRDEKADTRPALEAAERGINLLKDIPNIQEEVDRYRVALMNALVRQKQLIERFNRMKPKDWGMIESEEDALIKEAEQNGFFK